MENISDVSAPALYEAPRIERVLGPEDLDREVLYAGMLITTVDAQQG
jgi:hypothetical protein